MKKHIVLLAFTVLIAFGTRAQRVQSGLSLAANMSSIQGNGIQNTYSPGFIGGAFSRVTLNKKWNIQPEVLFNLTNNKKADNFINYYNINGSTYADTKIVLDYISVPVLLGYNINKLFTINAGPQYSFLAYDDENLLTTQKASAFKRNDVGLVAGAALKLENINFFARYTYGLANVNNIDDRYKWHNRQAVLGFNVAFL